MKYNINNGMLVEKRSDNRNHKLTAIILNKMGQITEESLNITSAIIREKILEFENT